MDILQIVFVVIAALVGLIMLIMAFRTKKPLSALLSTAGWGSGFAGAVCRPACIPKLVHLRHQRDSRPSRNDCACAGAIHLVKNWCLENRRNRRFFLFFQKIKEGFLANFSEIWYHIL